MEYTSDVETCIDMIKYEMFCVKEISLVKNEKWQINYLCPFFTVLLFLDLALLRTIILIYTSVLYEYKDHFYHINWSAL